MQSSPDDPPAAEPHETAEDLRRELERLGAIEGTLAAMERELVQTRREARSAVAICILLIVVLLTAAFLVTW